MAALGRPSLRKLPLLLSSRDRRPSCLCGLVDSRPSPGPRVAYRSSDALDEKAKCDVLDDGELRLLTVRYGCDADASSRLTDRLESFPDDAAAAASCFCLCSWTCCLEIRFRKSFCKALAIPKANTCDGLCVGHCEFFFPRFPDVLSAKVEAGHREVLTGGQ